MIPNHEGAPDEPIQQPHMDDWSTCHSCNELAPKTDYCPVCGWLVCEDCWDEHHAECNDDPADRSNPYEPDRQEEAA